MPEQTKHSNILIFFRITAMALLVMLLFSVWARSYSEHVAVPRFCDDPHGTLTHLQRVLREPRPAGDGSRRRYIVAAKLLYQLPRQSKETESAYLTRVRRHIEDTCR